MEHTDKFDDLLKQGIELYSGRTVIHQSRHDDPRVPGSYALRVVLSGKGKKKWLNVDFLICDHCKPLRTPEDVAGVLEECSFSSWPPKSGNLKFFL